MRRAATAHKIKKNIKSFKFIFTLCKVLIFQSVWIMVHETQMCWTASDKNNDQSKRSQYVVHSANTALHQFL